MDRRKFVKLSTATCGTAALLPKHLHAQTKKAAAPGSSGTSGARKSGTGKIPGYSGSMQTSDGSVINPDGSTQAGFSHTSSKSQNADPKAPYQMPLTQEEQDIMDGKKGPELAAPFLGKEKPAWSQVGMH